MLNVGAAELLVIFVVALLVFGPNRLPELARNAGKAMGEVRRMADGFQAEIARAAQPSSDTSDD
jgi:sec-independent protein translocase protein TatB